MSVLRSRILYQDGNFEEHQGMLTRHPGVTSQTAVTLPVALVTYDGANLSYEDLSPLYTGDVNAAPLPATAPGTWGQVRAAGRM